MTEEATHYYRAIFLDITNLRLEIAVVGRHLHRFEKEWKFNLRRITKKPAKKIVRKKKK